jgi:hypothetical protein
MQGFDMDQSQCDLDEEIKRTQLAAAKLELQIKELDLHNRPTFWKNALTNPVVLGAIITAFIAANTSMVSFLTSEAQRKLDLNKAKLQAVNDRAKFEGNLISNAIRDSNPLISIRNIEFFIRAGLVQDPDGRLQQFLTQEHKALLLPEAQ